jgi:hypothetical protein
MSKVENKKQIAPKIQLLKPKVEDKKHKAHGIQLLVSKLKA